VWLYHRFPLSLCDVEQLMAERGRGCDDAAISGHPCARERQVSVRAKPQRFYAFRWSRKGMHRYSDPRTVAGALLRCCDEKWKLAHERGPSQL
jgi:hypothetical protein